MKQGIGAGRTDGLFRFVRSRGFVLAGVGLASIYWLAEAATHAFLLHEGSFLYALSPRDPDELWTRPFVGLLFLVLGSSVQWLMARRRRAERMLRQQAYELGERIKELNCLYAISKLVERPGVSLPEILQGTAGAVASSWQYPEIARARISYAGEDYVTPGFRETVWKQDAPIKVHGTPPGALEVCYLEERPAGDEGPFLKEEQALIDAVAERLGGIIERSKEQQALRESEERFRTLVENANDGIYIRDAEGRITYANQRFADIHGRPLDDVIGVKAADLLHSDDRALLQRKGTWERVQAGMSVKAKARIVRPSGEIRYVDMSAVPILREGSLGRVFGIVRDITEVEKTAQLRTQFFANVSHELRTPLTSIVGYTDLILRGAGVGVSEEQEEFLRIIADSADELARLVNDVLDVERLESLEMPFELKPVRLDDVLEEVVQSLRAEAVGKGLALRMAPPEGLVVEADPDHLGRLFANLISNAVKYTPSGTIEVRTEERGGDAVIEVEDTGIGMSEEEVRQLFRRFFRAGDPHVRGVAGTGLGLSIAKAIVERHGGTIRVDSTPTVGTTFRVTLPLTPEDGSHPE